MAVDINFPDNIKPSSRSFTPGTYPQTEFVAQNGAKTVIRYGNKQVNAKLTLNFTNILDSQAFEILENYRQVNSEYNYVSFNQNSGLTGIGGDGNTMPDGSLGNLAAYFDAVPLGLRYRYDGPPTVTSVRPNRSNVQCKFVACLDGD
mgnify:CR=1 FL=1|tara:strand:- start:404 stop:844 length:441 start_codon:yes stop_codon:yes gene_type:complete